MTIAKKLNLSHLRNRDGRVELELEPLSVRLLKHQTVARPSQVTASSSSSFPTMVGAGGYGSRDAIQSFLCNFSLFLLPNY